MSSLSRENLREIALENVNIAISEKCRIRARNDAEAIERWLDEYFDKPATFRTYKKEAERFLVWLKKVRSSNLSLFNRDDVEAYIKFLKNPEPKEIWCGPRRKKSVLDSHWYPFAGPLSESGIRTAIASLNSLMSYLMDARYVTANPFVLVRRKNRFKKTFDEHAETLHERILQEVEWRALITCIDNEREETIIDKFKKLRLRFLVQILFFLGLRIDELSRSHWQQCRKINGKWWFFIRGKGDRLGKIPINSSLLEAIMVYRHGINKMPLPEADDSSPLIPSLNDKSKSLTVRQMNNLIKDLGIKASLHFPKDSESYYKLRRFSPHWLRHLSASRQDLAGISFTNIKSNLRHQNEQTTRLYVHAYDDERHKDMEKLRIT